MKRKTLDEMMAGMGFGPDDIGPNVTALRAVVANQIAMGLIDRSAGTWAPGQHSAETRAKAFLELEEAIDGRRGRFPKSQPAMTPRQHALAGEYAKEGHPMDEAIRLATAQSDPT